MADMSRVSRSPALPVVDLRSVPPEERAPAAPLAVATGARWQEVRVAAAGCRSCHLWERATQTVFGDGPVPAPLALVGEQPGDREDLEGEPFVGPAGAMLDRALEAAGIDRERAFVTNVVKHFKWRPDPRSKRRLHERPDRMEVGSCFPWVEAELALVRPEVLVALGATAANALIGPAVRVTKDHGRPLESDLAPLVVATIHPSAILRARGAAAREAAFAGLVDDLRVVARALGNG
jgi:uracil-DNA glycosylase family protein